MKILVIDGNKRFLDKLKKNLTLDGHSVTTASSGDKAIEEMMESNLDLVLVGILLSGLSMIELLEAMQKNRIDVVTIVITNHGSMKPAVEAMKAGAYDYLLMPFDIATLKGKLTGVEKELQLRKRLNASTSRSR